MAATEVELGGFADGLERAPLIEQYPGNPCDRVAIVGGFQRKQALDRAMPVSLNPTWLSGF